MLKPKYNNLSEAVGHYKALLKDLDQANPKDPTILESAPTQAPAKKKKKQKAAIVEEKQAAAPKYSPLVTEMRRLAGMDEGPTQFRDPGVLGSTRSNKAYFKF